MVPLRLFLLLHAPALSVARVLRVFLSVTFRLLVMLPVRMGLGEMGCVVDIADGLLEGALDVIGQ